MAPEPRAEKLSLTVNMKYVNRHLEKKVFNFEGLKNIDDLVEKGDHAVS